MTVSSLVTALAVGVTLGVCGRWVVPSGRGVPFWVLLAVAVGAAMSGVVVARFAGIGSGGVTAVEVALAALFAVAGVTVVAATAERRPGKSRYDLNGSR